ncbi:MAG: hypothetical protein KatS3mg124_0162 [Porticoccaceae bacterium]|nr:MAG: hypothetical protein KatS3mg124_0162 [Porticoccaceae bacterium]
MGVVHGLRAFVPRLLAARESAWIVNTASLAGLTSVPGLAAYCASKHAVVALSECLHHELARLDAPIRVAVLCPAFVPTAIAATLPAEEPWAAQVRRAVDRGRLSADEVAERALAGLAAGRFYLLPHPAGLAGVAARAEDIAAGHPPRDPTDLRPS